MPVPDVPNTSKQNQFLAKATTFANFTQNINNGSVKPGSL
jgi:hypothetical protein